jgi:hypothetical protein
VGAERVRGSPNNAKDNLAKAALYLDNDKDYDRCVAFLLTSVVQYKELHESVSRAPTNENSSWWASLSTAVCRASAHPDGRVSTPHRSGGKLRALGSHGC